MYVSMYVQYSNNESEQINIMWARELYNVLNTVQYSNTTTVHTLQQYCIEVIRNYCNLLETRDRQMKHMDCNVSNLHILYMNIFI